MKRSGLAFVITALAAIVLCFESANSCAPEFPEAVFTRQRGPDKPLQEFVNGKIGIILPSWQRAYLTVAYRYYSGKPLHRSEQRSLAEFWDYNGEVDRPLETKPIDLWLRERAKYTKTPPPNSLSQFESLGYASVINCAPPAFHTAAPICRNGLVARTRSFITAQKKLLSRRNSPKVPTLRCELIAPIRLRRHCSIAQT